ncbi:uncharacterized protein PHACADRAFT_192878 [Phanerochaete carnosa HHB-10118-sp]|uniref:DUF6593 domain-containing protein n=1 Tax=Phanerochaete carnosa (strain HHB-10118-sp) TaxID=650164 RepID=K5X4I0_PHACS|nr:uncharacterized protein PHACADRAFT_192878 [Phanerochaete carnosa HHB-10118-sp]EKM57742.1 hypothetical protein PHACADRAFT_192878 [Phanerochaete carnosa HHB-10118-sp]
MILDQDPFSDSPPQSPTETVLPDYGEAVAPPHPRASSGSRPPRQVIYMPPRRPSRPMIYTFMSWNAKLMLLMPPVTVGDRTPVANIDVSLNLSPFAPLSYITTVRRGGTTEGTLIGEFELAVAHNRATVKIGNHWERVASVLTQQRNTRHWKWRMSGVEFFWDCSKRLDDGSPMCICLDGRSSQLASFVPPPIDASPPLPDATLTVFPDGHEYFDHILLSALIVERKLTLSF